MTEQQNYLADENTGAWTAQAAQNYITQWGEHPLHLQVADWAGLREGETVVDIGCGSGTVVTEVASHLSCGKVTGIDPTPKMIEQAKQQTRAAQHAVPVDFIEAGAESMPFDNQSVDLVLAVNTLHHWACPQKGLDEVLRVLKPAGRLVIIDDVFAAPSAECNELKNSLKSIDSVVAFLSINEFTTPCVKKYPLDDIDVAVISVTKT